MPLTPLVRRVPAVIWLLFTVELILGVLFLLDRALDSPLWQLHVWFDFEHEAAVATWFSSMQLFCVSMVLALFSWGIRLDGERDPLILFGPPLLFLSLSADETIQVHEWIGYKLFPEELRSGSVFGYVGIWGFVLGPLVLACAGWIGWRARRYLLVDRRILRRFVLGFMVLVGAGAFVEELANFVERGSGAHMWQVFTEEMGEMVGVTLTLWASWELLRRQALQTLVARAREVLPPGDDRTV
jgi:hypothetical protein